MKVLCLDGVLAVPCDPQSAIAGSTAGRGFVCCDVKSASGVEGRVPYNEMA